MSLLQGVLSWVLSWAGLCQIMAVVGIGLVALVAVWMARLLARHAWYTHRLSCFCRPHADSWLMGHMGQSNLSSEQDNTMCVTISSSKFQFTVILTSKPCPSHVPGRSLLLSNGEEWLRRRRLLTPVFHFDILKSYVATFNTSTDTMHGKWRCLVAEGRANMEMFDHVTLMTLDSLLKCVFSYNSNCQELTSEYVSAIVELSDLIIDRRLKILHHWDWFYWKTQQGKKFKKALSVVHGFTSEVVQKRRTLINQQTGAETDFTTAPQRRKDFLDLILQSKDDDGLGLTDEEIQAEANTFMFAGHDTTASAICWTLYNLARHAHFQEKCRQEVMDLMQGRDRHAIEWEDLSNLTFTTMCIRESLRLHSPVQAVTRQYTQDMALPGGRTVPEGAICLVSIYGTHHNPTVWTNPNEFDPLRFDPSNTKKRPSHAFIPFSSGPRNCIGQKFALAELRVVVALTLLRFRLTLGVNPELGTSSGGIRRVPQLVLRAEGGLWLRLEPLTTPVSYVGYQH
uniref:aromatase n=1 Tax=Scophthalmus maximus TaxID=52904 RepID=A0A8D3CNQ1_SCOMX